MGIGEDGQVHAVGPALKPQVIQSKGGSPLPIGIPIADAVCCRVKLLCRFSLFSGRRLAGRPRRGHAALEALDEFGECAATRMVGGRPTPSA
jgi:hypothetical protein